MNAVSAQPAVANSNRKLSMWSRCIVMAAVFLEIVTLGTGLVVLHIFVGFY